MGDQTVELAFLRYREKGDPAALAVVFDNCAAELLRVALHLAADAAAAEDLLQETFLSAIESAADWDQARPLVPWLLGILANHARMRRRRDARPLEGTRERRGASDDPVRAAQAAEVTASVREAILALPEPYREVLLLHLVEGVEGARIAARLDRPPSTIRTQIQRGLDLLRKALPASFALGVAPLPLRGLDAIRAVVLARAAAHGSAVTFGAAKLWLVGVALVAFTSLWIWSLRGEPEAPARIASLATMASTSAPSSAPRDAAMAAPSSARAERFAPLAGPRGATMHKVRGRCMALETNVPLAGCAVEVRATKSWPPQQGSLLVRGQSDSEGRFQVEYEALARQPEWLLASAPGRPAQPVQIDDGKSERADDLGDLFLWRGYPVSGRVVDRDKTRLAGVEVHFGLLMLDSLKMHGHQSVPRLDTKTDAEGRFEIPDLQPPGHSLLFLNKPGWRPVHGVPGIEVGEGHDTTGLELVLEPCRAIHGVAVDESELPLANLLLCASPARGSPFPKNEVSAKTGAEGEFTLYDSYATNAPVTVEESTGAWLRKDQLGKLAWGSDGVRLLFGRESFATIELTVVEAGSGTPVEDYSAWCQLDSNDRANWERRRGPAPRGIDGSPAHHKGGRATLDPVLAGANVVTVVPKAGRWHAALVRTRAERNAHIALRVEVEKVLPLRVVVTNAAGEKLAGVTVEAIGPVGAAPVSAFFPVARLSMNPQWTTHALLGTGVTDARGEATLDARLGTVLVRVRGGACPPLLRTVTVSEGMVPLELVLHRGATLRGKLWPASVLEGRPQLRLVQASADPRAYLPQDRNGYELAADGSFELCGLPAGAWQVVMLLPIPGPLPFLQAVEPPLAQVTLREDAELRLDLDASAFAPASLRGVVRVDGVPLFGAQVDLCGRRPNGRGGWTSINQGQAALDKEGRFELPAVLPGEYRLRITVSGTSFSRQVGESIVLVSGQRLEQDLELVRRTLHVRLLFTDGTPCKDQPIELVLPDAPVHESMRTDERGIATMEMAPLEPVSIRVPAFDVTLGPVQLDARQKEATIDLRLPLR